MIERFEQPILHNTAPGRPDVCSSSICTPSSPKLPSHQSTGIKIAYPPRASEFQGAVPLTGALIRVKRNVNPVYPGNKGMCRKWSAIGSPSTPAPSPPVSLRDSREGGEGAGLLVSLADHLRGVVNLKIQKLKQQQNFSIRPLRTVSGFQGLTVCLVKLWKTSVPLVESVPLGTLGDRHE